ncbi:MAG: hypothetical protein KKH84_09905, partial [Proteobacteria bacterium]|nr:hypothetical protein [Pseudomonadota bacterium]
MNREKSGFRTLKKKILELLNNNDLEKSIVKILELPARQVVNPLFSFLYNADELLKWKAVIAMGAVVSDLADHNMESARIVMRRLLWNLNDESGGIGWGSPEAMGEIMKSQHPTSRGLAAWATGALGDKSAMPALKCLSKDNTMIRIFLERHLVD